MIKEWYREEELGGEYGFKKRQSEIEKNVTKLFIELSFSKCC